MFKQVKQIYQDFSAPNQRQRRKSLKETSSVKFWIDLSGNFKVEGNFQYIELAAALGGVLSKMIPGFRLMLRAKPVEIKFIVVEKRLDKIIIDL